MRLLDIKEVCRKFSVGPTWVYTELKAGRLPKPVSLGKRCTRWVESEIDEEIARRIAAAREERPQ
jgi:prophage regulatory protein